MVNEIIYEKLCSIALENECGIDDVLDLLISFYEKNKNNKIVNIGRDNNGVINLHLYFSK